MACWSAENATRAYLQAIKMGKRSKELDEAEFISALAAGNNAQLMVMACTEISGSIALSLVAVARQTGGSVVCIVPKLSDLYASRSALGPYAGSVKFVTGNAKALLVNEYKGADFVLFDCSIEDQLGVFGAAQEVVKQGNNGVIVGYKAFHKASSWTGTEFKTRFLPIGEGLLVSRVGAGRKDGQRRSRWVTRVDQCTGEEHVYRVFSPGQEIKAKDAANKNSPNRIG